MAPGVYVIPVTSSTAAVPHRGMLTTLATVRVSPASSPDASRTTLTSIDPSSRTVTARFAASGASFTSLIPIVNVTVASTPKGSAALTVTE